MYILQRLQHGLSGVPHSLKYGPKYTHVILIVFKWLNTTYNKLTQFKHSGALQSAQLKPQFSHIAMLQFRHSPSTRDLRVQPLHFNQSAASVEASYAMQIHIRRSINTTIIQTYRWVRRLAFGIVVRFFDVVCSPQLAKMLAASFEQHMDRFALIEKSVLSEGSFEIIPKKQRKLNCIFYSFFQHSVGLPCFDWYIA